MATADKIAKALGQQSSAPPHLKAALAYAASGLAVLPLNPRTKEPATKRGFCDATTNPETIRRFWRVTDRNVGIATGAVSGCGCSISIQAAKIIFVALKPNMANCR